MMAKRVVSGLIERMRRVGAVGARRRGLIRNHVYVTHLLGATGIAGLRWRMVETPQGHWRYVPEAVTGSNARVPQWLIPIFPRVRRPHA